MRRSLDRSQWPLTLLALVTHLAGSIVEAIPIDNDVTGSAVQCTADSITVNFETRQPFNGRIFVKGMVDNDQCVQSFSESSALYRAQIFNPSMSFSFGDCNMKRARTLAPQRGMMQSLVVIISFHKLFITKVDKAYRVQCFYMEAEKTVTSGFEVSMLTTDDLRDTGAMPTCTYTVRRGREDGPVVRFARVGEEVYHEWECDSDSHAVLVKSCYVDDGQNNRYDLVDERGCAKDPVIMQELNYDQGTAKVWVEAHVFKFADRPNVFFQCTVELCNRGEPECDAVTPPQCSQRLRVFKRSLRVMEETGPARILPPSSNNEVDLLSEPITVIDLEDTTTSNAQQLGFDSREFEQEDGSLEDFSPEKTELHAVCMSTTGFGILLAMVVVVFLIAAAVACVLCCTRQAQYREKPFIDRRT